MPTSKNRYLKAMDLPAPVSGQGGAAIDLIPDLAPSIQPTIPAPVGLKVVGSDLVRSDLTPEARVSLDWTPAPGTSPARYEVQYAQNSTFTAGLGSKAAATSDAQILGLITARTYYFRVRAIAGALQSGWSNVVNVLTEGDTTAPNPVTAAGFTWGNDGNLVLRFTNPTSRNFLKVRIRFYDAPGGTLLAEREALRGGYTLTPDENRALLGGPRASFHVVLTALSVGGVASTDVTLSPSKARPATPTVTVDFTGRPARFSAGAVAGAVGYRWTIDGFGTPYETVYPFFEYTLEENTLRHSGTPDPSLTYSVVAVDSLGQTSATPATGTATNGAPAATTISAFIGFDRAQLTITPSAATDLRDYRVRVYKDGALQSGETFFTSATRPTYEPTGAGSGSYQFDVTVYDVFGQASAASSLTVAQQVVDRTQFIADLRETAIYSDSLGRASAVLKPALTDDDTTSGGNGSNYPAAAGYNYIQVYRELTDRYRRLTIGRFGMASGSASMYAAASLDGVTWRWFAAPLTAPSADVRRFTEVGSQAAAEASPVTVSAATTITAWEFPVALEARYIRVYIQQTTVGVSVREFYPRRLVVTDDIYAETLSSISANLGAIVAGSLSAVDITGSTITGTDIIGGTVTGTTVQTAASGARVELTTANGLRTINGSGTTLVQLTAASGLTINADAAYSADRAIRFSFGSQTTEHTREGGFYVIEHEVTSALPGRIDLTTTNTTTAQATSVRISQDDSIYGDSVTITGAGLRVGNPAGTISAGSISAQGTIATDADVSAAGAISGGSLTGRRTAATSTDLATVLTVAQGFSGAAASGFGVALSFLLKSSTTDDRTAGQIRVIWNSPTDASRTGRLTLLGGDANGVREGFRVEGDGANPRISMYGAAAVARQTVTGSRASGAALADLLTKLAATGIIIDGTSA